MFKTMLLISLLALCQMAQATGFDAYRARLENDVLCGSHPDTDIAFHLKALKSSGAIAANEKIGAFPTEWEPFKVKPGFIAFGLPIKEVLLFPGYRANMPYVELTLATSPINASNAIKLRPASKGLQFKAAKDGTLTALNKSKRTAITIRKQGTDSVIGCVEP